jgi:curli production assembly/transport component CsgF
MKQKILFIFILISSFVYSQDLVYTPISPFFGGSTFNYQQILASANAQNSFTEAEEESSSATALENFTSGLNTRLLSSLSSSLFQQQLGDTTFTVGTYTFGDLVVEITPGTSGLNVNILNITTGEQTLIIIPDSN